MSTLSSSSTLAQVEASYDDNASWTEDKSTAKARAFVTAARMLLRRLPSSSQKGSNALTFRLDLIRQELAEAQTFLQAHDATQLPGPLVTRSSFQNFFNGGG